MPKAFQSERQVIPTRLWTGRIKEVGDESFSGKIFDGEEEKPSDIEMPLSQIVASEVGRILPGTVMRVSTTIPDENGRFEILSIDIMRDDFGA